MHLHRSSNSESFYESFSDLIFGTLAVFVMLLFVVLVQVSEHDRTQVDAIQQLQASLEASEQQTESAREQLDSMTEQLTALERAVRTRGLELIVAVDVTASMEKPLSHLVETVTTIAKVLPRVSPQFRIGIVAYRQTSAGASGLSVFPLSQILNPAKDGGASFGQLTTFVGALTPQRGVAPVGPALRQALGLFDRADADSYQALLLLGDVGVGEFWSGSGAAWKRDAADQAEEAAISQEVTQWVRAGERRSVVTLFTGDANDQNKAVANAGRDFFRRLAADAGQPDNFTQNSGKMLAYLLSAVVQD